MKPPVTNNLNHAVLGIGQFETQRHAATVAKSTTG